MSKRIPLKKDTYDKLEEVAKAQGKTADEKASEIVEKAAAEDTVTPEEAPTTVEPTAKPRKRAKKGKGKESPKPTVEEKPMFPKEGKINKYGFLHIDLRLAEVMGLKFGKEYNDVPVQILGFQDGVLSVKILR